MLIDLNPRCNHHVLMKFELMLNLVIEKAHFNYLIKHRLLTDSFMYLINDRCLFLFIFIDG